MCLQTLLALCCAVKTKEFSHTIKCPFGHRVQGELRRLSACNLSEVEAGIITGEFPGL